MPDDPTPNQTPSMPDVHPGNVAPLLCKKLCVPGCILLTSNDDGSMMLISHGVSHARANEIMSRAIQINLNQHDEFVRAGLAGNAAAEQQAFIDGDMTAAGAAQ